MDPRVIVAFDPGGTTGWASFQKPNTRDGYHCGQIKIDRVWAKLDEAKLAAHMLEAPLTVVYERFNFIPKPKVVLTPVEVIGIIKEWCRQNSIRPIPQQPSQRKWYTDERLKGMGVWHPGLPHAMDAMRHLLFYLGAMPPKEVIDRH
jgi:hypothetical protein